MVEQLAEIWGFVGPREVRRAGASPQKRDVTAAGPRSVVAVAGEAGGQPISQPPTAMIRVHRATLTAVTNMIA